MARPFVGRHSAGTASRAGLPLPPALAVYVVAEVCRALAYAHRRVDEHGEPLGIVQVTAS